MKPRNNSLLRCRSRRYQKRLKLRSCEVVLVTFKDLKKRVNQETLRFEYLNKLRNQPFWIWNTTIHKQRDIDTAGQCCFNHIVGLPNKEKIERPMFDYEKLIYDSLIIHDCYNPLRRDIKYKHLWIKKSTGLGITEFFLRLMAWLCLKDNSYGNSQMCIVTGPNIDIAIKLIKRLKGIFEPRFGITFTSKETALELNGCTIEAYPSNHLDAYRALDNPKFIFIDEADFFRNSEQEDVRHVSERYIGKSDPYIVMVSTPNAPDGLFERIEKEPEESCIYKRLKLDYTYGLNRIYTNEEIEKAKASPSFEREYNLKYLGRIGNVFHSRDIDATIELGKKYNPDVINRYARKSMGIDPAWGSSAFGIVVTQWVDNTIQIIYAEEYQKPDYNEMLDIAQSLISKYMISKIFIDGANPSFIRSLKYAIDEETEYEYDVERSRKMKIPVWEYMDVIPIPFSTHHKDMLAHVKMLIEEEKLVAINPVFDKLLTSLRTSVDKEGTLDKEATSYNDIFDAFRLALYYYQ